MNCPNQKPTNLHQKLSWRDRWAMRKVTQLLNQISAGSVTIVAGDQVTKYGRNNDLSAVVRVNRARFYRKFLFGPVSIANSFIDGDWQCDDLTSLIKIFLRNRAAIDRSSCLPARVANFGYRLLHWLNANTQRGSRRNIQAHYDLGNDFYRLWLDETMAYSSGIFLDDSATLADASTEKFDRICRKLDINRQDQVLEIGTGFGGFALHAAGNYGCDVTTTTISKQQFEFSQSRFRTVPFEPKIKLLQEDYRNLNGKFDKLVSIEMIEAVGHRFLDQYFEKCGQLLREDGCMVLQSIVMPERGYQRYLKSVDFIQRHVFPGGCLPSLATILESVGRSSNLRFVHAEDIAPHYEQTLRHWRTAFQANLDEVRQQGYSEKLTKLWSFYLSYCEAAFAERQIGVLQIHFDKPLRQHDPIKIGYRSAQPAAVDARVRQTEIRRPSNSKVQKRKDLKSKQLSRH